MKNTRHNVKKATLFAALLICVLGFSSSALADENTAVPQGQENSLSRFYDDGSLAITPLSFAFVTGDYEQFRAHNWRDENYVGGVDAFKMEGSSDDGFSYDVHGKLLFNTGKAEGEIRLEKEGLGYFLFEYEEFRKYYDTTGGVYHQFELEDAPKLDRDLSLDIGHYAVELGLTPEDMPHFFFRYEHEYLSGSKSRLTWGEREESGVTRNITPSWQELDEDVDVFELRQEYTLAGIELEAEQRWEVAEITSRRYEYDTSPSNSAGDNKARIHDQRPETRVFTNTVKASKWFLDNKLFSALGYQYMRLTNTEQESILEYDGLTLSPRWFGFGHNEPDNFGKNDIHEHSFIWNLAMHPVSWLQTIIKIKGNVHDRDGESTLKEDRTDPPNGIIDRFHESDTTHVAKTMAESIAVRFKAIPRTSVYSEIELSQTTDYLSEDRQSFAGEGAASGSETFERETLTEINKGNFTAGFSVQPLRMVTLTNQFRYKRTNNDYDHERETNPGVTAFYDSINHETVEYFTRLTLRPCNWFNTSLRYMIQDIGFWSRYDSQNTVHVTQNQDSITFDVTVIPLPTLFITNSFTHVTASVKNSVARDNLTMPIPTFNSEYNSWMSNIDFHATEDLSFNTAFYYTMADNHDDVNSTQVSYGAAYDRVGLHVGVDLAIRDNMSVELGYDYQNYTPDTRYKSTDYSAHIVGGRVRAAFG